LKQADGSFVVAGSVTWTVCTICWSSVRRKKRVHHHWGLVTEWLGHVPHIGEVVERDGIRLEVLAGRVEGEQCEFRKRA